MYSFYAPWCSELYFKEEKLSLTYKKKLEAIQISIYLGITTVLTMTFLGLEARKNLPKVMVYFYHKIMQILVFYVYLDNIYLQNPIKQPVYSTLFNWCLFVRPSAPQTIKVLLRDDKVFY